MECTNCGRQNNPGVSFCAKCGTAMRQDAQPAPSRSAFADSEEGGDVRFFCPSCGQRLAAPPDMAGGEVDCPRCKKAIRVPASRPGLPTPVVQAKPEKTQSMNGLFAVLAILFLACMIAAVVKTRSGVGSQARPPVVSHPELMPPQDQEDEDQDQAEDPDSDGEGTRGSRPVHPAIAVGSSSRRALPPPPAKPVKPPREFTYKKEGGRLTITEYTGAGGEVSIPVEIDGFPVVEIGDYVFSSCTGVTGVTVPAGVTRIGNGAFDRCPLLTRVTLPDTVVTLGDSAFFESGRLTDVRIPPGVRSIPDGLFNCCSNLVDIEIPAGVTNIGRMAFYHCFNLRGIRIPPGVRAIGNRAFTNCGNLTRVDIPDGVEEIPQEIFSGCSNLAVVTIPDSVKMIRGEAFLRCVSLTDVSISKNVILIELMAFAGCKSVSAIRVDARNSIFKSVDGVLINKSMGELLQYPAGRRSETYTIPPGVSGVDYGSFADCSHLVKAFIPEGVRNLGAPFSGCLKLTEISVAPENENYRSNDGVLFDRQTGELVCYPGGRPGPYAVPPGVAGIGEGAFTGCVRLTAVSFPSSVQFIGSLAFEGCAGLTSVQFPQKSISIGDYAFKDCRSLASVTLSRNVTLGEDAFDPSTRVVRQ